MTASFSGSTFYVEVDNDAYRPAWSRVPRFVRTPIPGAAYDDLQFAGTGNYRITLTAYSTSDADTANLVAKIGTSATLTNPFGDSVNYASSVLCDVRELRRLSAGQQWHMVLDFERAGT